MWFTQGLSKLTSMGLEKTYPGNLRKRMSESLPDLYFSGDVETDGPIPGEYSLLSFALVVVGSFDGNRFDQFQIGERSFYRELRPISNSFQSEALLVNGLNRESLRKDGAEPAKAMQEAFSWVLSESQGYRPIFVGYPAVFDWMWMFWYFTRYVEEGSPFGYSGCLDVKTLLAIKAGIPVGLAKRSFLPSSLVPSSHRSHNALDDAIEQGKFFARLLTWNKD